MKIDYNKCVKRKTFFTMNLLFLFLAFNVQALSYEDVYSTLENAFSAFTSDNEGSTSFRSLNIPIGGKAESMGSAFTALCNDISFFEYNPSASSILDNTELAVFHNSWIADSSLETLAFTDRNDNFGWGAALKCFYVPFSEYSILGDKVATGYYSETTAILNLSHNFLAGYNFKGIAFGGNMKVSYRSVPDYTDDDTGKIISHSGLSQSGVAVMLDLGAKVRFNFGKFYKSREPNFLIGVSLDNAGVGFTGFGPEGKKQLDDGLPTKLSVGLGYKPTKPLYFTFEFQQPINILDFSSTEKFSIGAGTMVQITDWISAQSGILIKGGNPRFSLGTEFKVNKVLMNLNYTFDFTTSKTPVNRFSLSAKLNLGDKGRAQRQLQVDELYAEGLHCYTEGHLQDAIDKWEEALSIDPTFDPAKEGISAASDSLELQQEIRNVQTLD